MKIELMTRDAQERAASKAVERLVEIREHQKKNGVFKRTADVGAVDVEARTAEISFSSEVEYQRWFGIEVLGHGDGEVIMDRITNKAALLWMHDWADQRGVVESARIDADGKGRAVVRLSKSAAGEQLLQDMADGIITKVSVGYMVHGIKLVEEREDVDVYRVTSWEPYELSMVSVPADDTVGLGRGAENPQEEPKEIPKETSPVVIPTPEPAAHNRTPQTMKEIITRDAAGNKVRAMVNEQGEIVQILQVLEMAGAENLSREAEQRGREAEAARVKGITDMGRTYKADQELISKFIAEGKTVEDFQRELLHQFGSARAAQPLTEQMRGASLGLTDKEVRSFSIMRAIRAIIPGASQADIKAAGFELEASRVAAEAYGKQTKGIIIPNDILADSNFARAAFSTTGGAGYNVVDTTLAMGSFIELLRKKAWIMKRARTMGGLVGNVDIPRQNGTNQVYWVGEGQDVGSGAPSIDQIALTPKTIGTYTDITRRLMMQASMDVESFVRDDMLKVIALALDKVAVYGPGTQFQPRGVKNFTGINAVDFASAGAPTFPEFVAMETAIASDDADVGSMSYAFNAAIRGHCKTTLKFDAAGSATIWENGGTVNGYTTDVSNQLNTGDVFFGNWQDFIIAMWGGLELRVDTAALALSGGYRLIALQDVDTNLRHVESICYGSDTVS